MPDRRTTRKSRIVPLFRQDSSFHLIDEFKDAAAPVNVIYSQWLGYLDGNHADYFGSVRISDCRSDPAVNFVYAHTSGHAPLKDLQKLVTHRRKQS
jgi:ribonuclease J